VFATEDASLWEVPLCLSRVRATSPFIENNISLVEFAREKGVVRCSQVSVPEHLNVVGPKLSLNVVGAKLSLSQAFARHIKFRATSPQAMFYR
jgi:hypothetical protein